MPDPRSSFEVQPAPAALRRRALDLVLSDVPAERRAQQIDWLVEAATDGEWGGLWVAQQGAELCGAVWARQSAGRMATVWPPIIVDGAPAPCAAALASAVAEHLAREEVRVAHALVATPHARPALALLQAGFEHLADLLYMVCLSGEFPAEPPDSPLTFEAIASDDATRLPWIVEHTYEGTLDCPRLNGVRRIADVLDGYRAANVAGRAPWFFVRRDDHDAGCLLLADEPADDQCEILYIGLLPEARRRGFGRALVRHAQWIARQAGHSRLTVAVDAANVPAVKTYAATGFQTWNRRSALVRIFPNGGDAS